MMVEAQVDFIIYAEEVPAPHIECQTPVVHQEQSNPSETWEHLRERIIVFITWFEVALVAHKEDDNDQYEGEPSKESKGKQSCHLDFFVL
jgi:hypothetical protein